jgi:transposase
MKTVKRQRYSNDFKDRALTLVGLGRPVPEVAEELGIGTSILYRWTLAQRQGVQDVPAQLGGVVQRAVGELDEAAELRRLRKENAQLLLENDILKKAAVILGTHAQPQSKLAR